MIFTPHSALCLPIFRIDKNASVDFSSADERASLPAGKHICTRRPRSAGAPYSCGRLTAEVEQKIAGGVGERFGCKRRISGAGARNVASVAHKTLSAGECPFVALAKAVPAPDTALSALDTTLSATDQTRSVAD